MTTHSTSKRDTDTPRSVESTKLLVQLNSQDILWSMSYGVCHNESLYLSIVHIETLHLSLQSRVGVSSPDLCMHDSCMMHSLFMSWSALRTLSTQDDAINLHTCNSAEQHQTATSQTHCRHPLSYVRSCPDELGLFMIRLVPRVVVAGTTCVVVFDLSVIILTPSSSRCNSS